jgi:hypothetical protein
MMDGNLSQEKKTIDNRRPSQQVHSSLSYFSRISEMAPTVSDPLPSAFGKDNQDRDQEDREHRKNTHTHTLLQRQLQSFITG